MSDPDYSELAARVLAGRPSEQRAPRVDRDRGISVIAQAMAERLRRRRARRVWFSGLAAAAVLALATGAWLRFDAGSGDERAVCGADCDAGLTGYAGHASFPPGSHWTAGNAGLSVGFGRVTRLDLEPASEVLYKSAEGARRFRLLRGALHARVEKLGRGQRFIVETHDAEVEVRGTAFDVAVAPTPTCGTSTRVTVREGVVEVRAAGGAHRLHVGESWPAACDDAVAAAAPTPAPAAPPVSVAVPGPRPKSGARAVDVQAPPPVAAAKLAPEVAPAPEAEPSAAPAAPPPLRSSLVEQNDLYARAVAARRSGQPSLALELYAELARRFPASALLESALIERVRILQKLDPGRASAEARVYLRRFPNGFARDEARAVLEP